MTPITTLADTIAAVPLPVLFLDTCVLLDIIRAADRKHLALPAVTSARTLRERMRDQPPVCYLVGSSILPTEYQDNHGAACQDLVTATSGCDLVLAIGAVLGLAQGQRAAVAVVAQEVTKLADDLLQFTRILAPDSVCLERAFERVRTKKQPARNGKIKDAYLLEQCLELCRVLRGRAFQERKLLCSSNTSDFAKPNSSQFDQDIAGDASQAGLEYFTSLSAAVGSLRLSSA